VAGESVFALVVEDLLPVADEVLADAEGVCGLGDRVALLGDEALTAWALNSAV
jgi:hypothetical protein